MSIDAATAKRIGRGRTIALSYAAMTGLEPDTGVGIDTAVLDCVTDLLHALVAEPFTRAGLGAGEKYDIAEELMAKSLALFALEIKKVTDEQDEEEGGTEAGTDPS